MTRCALWPRWPSPSPPNEAVVIVHSLAVSVEQLCARSPDAPSIERLRPPFCVSCGEPARHGSGALQLVGHGLYSRQVRGLSEQGWIVIWVRRFLCVACGHTISRLPDWLHPWRWYAAPVIVEALYRHTVLRESARELGRRFGWTDEASTGRRLRRWRRQLLVSLTLWGWLGPRLGVRQPAADQAQAASRLHRLLAVGGAVIRAGLALLSALPAAVRTTLRDLVHARSQAGQLGRFRAGRPGPAAPAPARPDFPTEQASGPDPP
jgi:hypothetical protein